MGVDLIATHYKFRSDWESMEPISVNIVRMNSPFYDGERWAVRKGSFCLGVDGFWELEPIPSSRDDEFYEKFRFPNLDIAVNTFLANQEINQP